MNHIQVNSDSQNIEENQVAPTSISPQARNSEKGIMALPKESVENNIASVKQNPIDDHINNLILGIETIAKEVKVTASAKIERTILGKVVEMTKFIIAIFGCLYVLTLYNLDNQSVFHIWVS